MNRSSVADILPIPKEAHRTVQRDHLSVRIDIRDCRTKPMDFRIFLHQSDIVLHLLRVLLRKRFIRIEHRYPGIAAFRDGEVFRQRKVILPGKEVYLRTHLFCDFHCSVRASGVDHNLFRNDAFSPGKCPFDILFFIFHNHCLRYLHCGHSLKQRKKHGRTSYPSTLSCLNTRSFAFFLYTINSPCCS